jgi:hypothetical protein
MELVLDSSIQKVLSLRNLRMDDIKIYNAFMEHLKISKDFNLYYWYKLTWRSLKYTKTLLRT